MIIGIGVLDIFISTFGAALVESRLKMRKEEEDDNNSSSGGEREQQIAEGISSEPVRSKSESAEDNNTIPGTTNFNAEAKNLIKHKIDETEEMNEQEVKILIDRIRTLHSARDKGDNNGGSV